MNLSRARIAALGLTLGAAFSLAPAASGQGAPRPTSVRAWEGTETIPTYALRSDDTSPHFFELEGSGIYPYTMQDDFSGAKSDHVYRAVYLENEYLRVLCLPGLGGRIQSVLDKVTGQEMLYRNRVIRPGHLAQRGAWISGGVEWNRGPRGHAMTTFSPVDVLTTQHPDGSASLLIGTTEQNFRTGWQVTVTLRPGARVLEEQIRLFNPTDGFHPYYFWNNAAFPASEGTRLVLPMSLGHDHGGKQFFSWPQFDGRDLSWVRNHAEPTSIFGYQVAFDFFGAYDVDRDFGVVQVADHRYLPGKKAWTWGQSDAGLVAQAALTDSDGPYIELQSGPLPTQSDFGMLAPGQEISWKEWWYPVGGLGDGFEYATRNLAVQRVDLADRIELRIASNGSFPAAEVEIGTADGRLVRSQLDLSPARTDSVSIPRATNTPERRQEPLRVRIREANGEELLSYQSPLLIPQRQPPTASTEATISSAETEYLRGDALDRGADRVAARRQYRAALEIDPGHSPSLRALAVLEIESGRYGVAREHLLAALRRDGSDGLTWYLLAVSRLQDGDNEGAQDAGYETTKRAGTTALGHDIIGRARARMGDYRGATEAAALGLSAGGGDYTRLFELAVLGTYGTGDLQTATILSRQATDAGTLRLVPHAVQALGSSVALAAFVERARGWLGEPEFAFIELSLAFADLGLVRDASNVLEIVSDSAGPARRPLPMYFIAYYQNLLGNAEASARWLRTATAVQADVVFPSRPETLAVLRHAVKIQPEDARAHLYLGNLYAGLGRLSEAVDQWHLSVAHGQTLAQARRNLGFYEWKVAGDLDAAASWLQQARRIAPQDQTLTRDLATLWRQQGRIDETIAVIEAIPAEARRTDVTLLLARAYLDAHRFDDTIELLEATRFTSREGDTGSWQLYANSHIARGVRRLDKGSPTEALADFDAAMQYPSNLNIGRPHRPAEARAEYWRGRALTALGRTAEADAAWQRCVAGAATSDEQLEHIALCSAARSETR